jgi:hypothetical protein
MRPRRHPRLHATSAPQVAACTQLERLAGEPRRLVLLYEQSRCRGTTDFPGDAQLRIDIRQVPLDGPRAKCLFLNPEAVAGAAGSNCGL